MKICEVCGRKLRTGIKYCYTCRSIRNAGKDQRWKNKHQALVITGTCVFIWIYYLFGGLHDEIGTLLFNFSLIIGFPMLLLVVLKLWSEKIRREKNEYK